MYEKIDTLSIKPLSEKIDQVHLLVEPLSERISSVNDAVSILTKMPERVDQVLDNIETVTGTHITIETKNILKTHTHTQKQHIHIENMETRIYVCRYRYT